MTNMVISRSIECALDTARSRSVLRDIARLINYRSPEMARDIAHLSTPDTLSIVPGWKGLPEWVRFAEVGLADGKVKLSMAIEPEAPPAEIAGVAGAMASELAEMFGHRVRPFRPRVFCLGWEKTGTSSITAAMRRLGIFSWHSCPWVAGITHALNEIPTNPRPDLAAVAEYDFLSDMPICALHRELDEAYPGSLFILTTRPVDAWLPSAIAEIEKGTEASGTLPAIVRWAYETSGIDADTLRNRYLRHQAEVLEYFSGRPDLLVIDLAEGNPWPKLCGFLGLSVPETPFPWFNQRAAP